jgi:carbohydrate kinase of FGGY family protein
LAIFPASPVEVRVPSVPVVLGVDVGTSSIKAACYGDDERLRGSTRLATPWGLDVDGPTLLHPQRLLDAVMAAITGAISGLDGVEVRALGIGGMGETGLLCRADADPGGPVIGWADQRGVQEARDIARILDAEKMAGWSGRHPSALLPAATLWSMRRHGLGPTRGERWLSAPEWLCAVLGGDLVAEPSLASRTGLFDIVSGMWRDDIVDLVGIRGALPEIAPATRPRGCVSAEYGVIAGASISVAGHDHLMAALGVGAVGHGDVFDSCGTNEAIVGSTEPATAARAAAAVATGGTMSVHVLPDLAAAFAPPFKTGEVLSRVLGALVGDRRDCVGIKALASAAACAAPLGADVVGASDDELRVLAGREPQARVWRTAVDQVVELGCNRVAVLERVVGPARRIIAAGGWLDELVAMAKRRSFGNRFQAVGGTMAGTLGAARIARIGSGRWPESTPPQSSHERTMK